MSPFPGLGPVSFGCLAGAPVPPSPPFPWEAGSLPEQLSGPALCSPAEPPALKPMLPESSLRVCISRGFNNKCVRNCEEGDRTEGDSGD